MITLPQTAPRRLQVLALLVPLLVGGCGQARADTEDEGDRITAVLGIVEGMHVADVGAGDGEWTRELAQRVGAEGRVWATEVERKLVRKLRRAVASALPQVNVRLGDQEDTGLPAGCCDAVLLRMVYHHFTDPESMRASLREALRPGGRIAIIDIVPQKHWRELPDVPKRGGHGIGPEDLIAEMEGAGFTLVARHDDWNGDAERYCLLFER